MREHEIHESPRLEPDPWVLTPYDPFTGRRGTPREIHDWHGEKKVGGCVRWLHGACLERHFDVPLSATGLWLLASKGQFDGAVPYGVEGKLYDPYEPGDDEGDDGWGECALAGPLDCDPRDSWDVDLCPAMQRWLLDVVGVEDGETVWIKVEYEEEV